MTQPIEHVVTIRIRQDSDDGTKTDDQIRQWVLGHFDGCDYGAVSVDSVRTTGDPKQPSAKCPSCGNKVLTYVRSEEATRRYAYHDNKSGKACIGGGKPLKTKGMPLQAWLDDVPGIDKIV